MESKKKIKTDDKQSQATRSLIEKVKRNNIVRLIKRRGRTMISEKADQKRLEKLEEDKIEKIIEENGSTKKI